MTWLELMIKLDFEKFLEMFRHQSDLDFTVLHRYLDIAGPRMRSLCLTLFDSYMLNSGHYWVQAVLTRMTKLEYLIINDDDEPGLNHAKKMLYLLKGIIKN